MADIWSLIGVILGILFVIFLISSKHVDDERQESNSAFRYYYEEDDLLDDLEELILIEDLEEELDDERSILLSDADSGPSAFLDKEYFAGHSRKLHAGR